MSEWKEVKLRDVCEIQTDKISVTELTVNNYISTENMLPNKRGIQKASSLPTTKQVNFFEPGNILFSNIRTYFKKVWYAKFNGGASNDVIVFKNKDLVNSKFLYYIISNDRFINYSVVTSKGTKMPRGDKTALMNFKFLLPPLQIQKKIADILSVIDEKIETLQNINETLEEMAKAIFKAWFVDFDIVKAKTYDKSDSEIAKEFEISEEIVKLFPSEFIDSEIGKIPKGWEVKKLGDFFPIKTGKKNANIATNNGIYPFFTCSQEVLKTDSYSFNDSAILLAGNGDFNIKWYRGKFEAYQRTYVLIPYDKNNLGYLFFAMKHFLDLITGASQGSVIKFITKGMIENFKIIYPNNIKFINFFNQILDNVENNTNQIQTLQNLIDTLLPKLINGEIEVDELNIKGFE